MPMEDMAKDVEFGKKWMFAIAASIKKGLHLNIIHNLDRPFNEMMLGLESWIPIYMTGQVSPYYLKESQNNLYQHLNYVSNSAALTGECLNGHHNKGKYYITNKEEEIKYYKEKMITLFKIANPLMEIYRKEKKSDYEIFHTNESKIGVNRKRILSSLPLFTINDNTLINILKKNNVDSNDIELILQHKNEEKKYVDEILKNYSVTDVIPSFSKEDFKINTPNLALENIFYDKKIKYDFDSYNKHLSATKEYAKNHFNYTLETSEQQTFKNISINILEKKCVIITKNNDPIIHFVIKHPKLVYAIENFTPLVQEQ